MSNLTRAMLLRNGYPSPRHHYGLGNASWISYLTRAMLPNSPRNGFLSPITLQASLWPWECLMNQMYNTFVCPHEKLLFFVFIFFFSRRHNRCAGKVSELSIFTKQSWFMDRRSLHKFPGVCTNDANVPCLLWPYSDHAPTLLISIPIIMPLQKEFLFRF